MRQSAGRFTLISLIHFTSASDSVQVSLKAAPTNYELIGTA